MITGCSGDTNSPENDTQSSVEAKAALKEGQKEMDDAMKDAQKQMDDAMKAYGGGL